MKLRDVLAIGVISSLALTGCNEKSEESAAEQAPATEKAAPAAAQESAAPAATSNPHAGMSTEQAAAAASEVAASVATPGAEEPAPMGEFAGTFTVAEVFAKAKELNGKAVAVKGEVTKVSNGIMGRSWIHVSDGTGEEGSNDLIFTSTKMTATVGDKIIAQGTVAADKDFGYGYFYSAIAENSVFTMQ